MQWQRLRAQMAASRNILFLSEKESMVDISKYSEYIDINSESIAKFVDLRFRECRSDIREKFISKIRKSLIPTPVHYIWKYDGNPYDASGIIVPDGCVDMNQTVKNFLEYEYTGNKEPTYESGMGWHYCTYGDELSYDTFIVGSSIMNSVIQDYLESHFGISLSEDEFFSVKECCNEFDLIYDSSLCFMFFDAVCAMEFVDLTDLKLFEVLSMHDKEARYV